jgi:hypothetical protein
VAQTLQSHGAVGYFARDQGQYSSQAAVDKLYSALNLLLCGFATAGLVSQPATYADIRGGKLIGRYASIVGGGGSFGDRTWGHLPCSPRSHVTCLHDIDLGLIIIGCLTSGGFRFRTVKSLTK